MHPDLPQLVQVLSESTPLRRAITDLHLAPLSLRRVAIERILSEMRANQEAPEDIALISSLLDPKIFDAVMAVLTELDYSP